MPPPNLNLPIFLFSSVWDYVPTRFYLAGDVDAWRASDLIADGYDRVDLSPRDHQSRTCVICILSDTLDGRHVAKRGSMNLHQTVVTFRDRGHYAITRFFIGRSRSLAILATRGAFRCVRSSSNRRHRDRDHLPSDGGCSSKYWSM